jgi:hypothetical protein
MATMRLIDIAWAKAKPSIFKNRYECRPWILAFRETDGRRRTETAASFNEACFMLGVRVEQGLVAF